MGHGVFTLQHTFEPNYGGILTKSQTENLMDYRSGSELAAFQWNVLQNPAPITLFDAEEDNQFQINDKDYWEGKKITWIPNTPQLYKAKTALRYDAAASCMMGANSRVYFRLTNGDIFRVTTLYTQYGELDRIEYEIYVTQLKEWFMVDINSFETNCLSCDLQYIQKSFAKFAGRYLLPVEDIYILLEGSDFDGNEASRIAAGGFIVLETVQAAKIFKLVKGAKVLTKTGASVNVARRVAYTGTKKITQSATIDICAQFIVNFISESVINPNADADEIMQKALHDINVGSALWSGLISYTSFTAVEQNSLECAYRVLKSIENGDGYKYGGLDCMVMLGTRCVLKYFRNTDAAKQFAKAISDAGQHDIIMQKLSKIMTSDQMNSFIEALSENGIKKEQYHYGPNKKEIIPSSSELLLEVCILLLNYNWCWGAIC